MLLSFLNNKYELTTSGIIAVVFFCFIVVLIAGLTIGFFVYRNHVRKIYKVERQLTIYLNHPIEKKIKRLSNVADNINDYEDAVDSIKSLYISLINDRVNALNDSFRKSLTNKEIFKFNKANAAKINAWMEQIDVINAEMNAISVVIDVLLNVEMSLRDDLIEFMEEWNTIEEAYEQQQNNGRDNLVNEKVISEFTKAKNKLLSQYDKAIAIGDYERAKEVFASLNELGKNFLKETNLLPQYLDYFKDKLPNEKAMLLDANSTNDYVRNLKKEIDEQKSLTTKALKNNDLQQTMNSIYKIYMLIEQFKHDRKLENAFEAFIEENSKDLDSFFNEIESGLEAIKKEDSDEYEVASHQLRDEVSRPVESIKKIISKIQKQISSSKRDTNALDSERTEFEDNLNLINDGIELLKSIKTKDSKIEKEYINYLVEILKTKSTLISAKDILDNPKNGLDEKDLSLRLTYFKKILDLTNSYNVKDAEQFDVNYPTALAKKNAIAKVRDLADKSEQLYAKLLDDYYYFNLATAIKIANADMGLTVSKEAWNELMTEFATKQYKQFVKDYITESEGHN